MAKGLINKLKKGLGMSIDEKIVKDEVSTEEPKTKKKSRSKRSSSKKELEELKIELAEARDKHLRLFAEFENFKKRNTKERLELMSTAARTTVEKILPVLDDFDRYKKSADDENNEEQISEGVLMVYNKMYTVLASIGVKPMESNGLEFDPELHEAITEISAPSDDMKGKIVDTIERGYYLHDKIIRFAKVVVGK